MNAQYLDQARSAYRAGDFSAAAQMFAAAKDPSEIAGEVDHLRGNALMKLGLWNEAAVAYNQALADTAYGKRGALHTNLGKAYAASGSLDAAAESFREAVRDTTYATPYKAYLGLGNALLAQGNIVEAGTAFRQAAIDAANPAPATALSELAGCFIKLGRPGDAVETYRTALDFAGPRDDTRAINAGLGEALFAQNRPADAVDAFTTATSDGIYQLTPEQQTAFQQAQDALDALSAQRAMAPAGATASAPVDPLDPLGKSGALMPDPSDTGFFDMSEAELIQQDRQEVKVRRKKRHTGLKVFLVLIVVLILAAGGLGFAYTRGLGFPSQQDALTGLFNAVTDGTDASAYLAPNLDDSARSLIESTVPEGATPAITAMDQSMTSSTAEVEVQLSLGGTQTYKVEFVRSANYIGWAVASIEIDFSGSNNVSDGSDSTDDSAAATDDTATDADAAPADGADAAGTDGAATDASTEADAA